MENKTYTLHLDLKRKFQMNKINNLLTEVIADAISTFLIEELVAIDIDLEDQRTTKVVLAALDIVKERKEWVAKTTQLELPFKQ